MVGASIETTLELWASSLRDVKARMRPLFRRELAASADRFLDGLLGEERRKTGWMRAEAAGDPGPWRQQAILGRGRWDADALRDIVRDYALETLADTDAVLVIDETGFLKQGKASCGVARQYTVLERLLEVLLIEALRSGGTTDASPGLLRGLADERLAGAIRRIHESPDRPWTVAKLAKEAGLSRSAFYEPFGRAVGVAPMEYLLAWRMALAKDMLRKAEASIAEIAERVGYSSASTFSVAFVRHVGSPPARYARQASVNDAPQNETGNLAESVAIA